MIDDVPPGGNSNGRFDAGETAEFYIGLRNVGTEAVAAVNAEIRSGHPLFVITDAEGSFGDIPAGETRTNDADRFAALVDPSMPLETPVQCSILVDGTDEYVDTLFVTFIIGQIRQNDPIPDGTPALYWAYDDVDTLYDPHPEFEWVEVSGIGTMLSLTDDQTIPVNLPLGFIWRYYGLDFSQVSICGNGWVAPGFSDIATYTNTALPNVAMPPLIAPVWDDFYPPVGGGVWYYYDQPNDRFIIEYDSVAYFANQSVLDKFEVIINGAQAFDNNEVIVQYLTANNYGSITAGLQDPSLATAIQCYFDGSYHRGCAPIAAGRAIKYSDRSPQSGLAGPDLTPTGFALHAVPNPSTGAVRFSTSLPGGSTAAIYDNSGRLVRTLDRTLNWDGLDADGSPVTPGIYFCRARAGSLESQTKLVVTR